MGKKVASADWTGSLKDGQGNLAIGSRQFSSKYNFSSRFEDGDQANPEELLGAAEAACFTMTLVGKLDKAGIEVESLETTASINTRKTKEGLDIQSIDLHLTAKVKDVESSEFRALAEQVKSTCPVSKALAMTINLDIDLEE